MKISFGSDNHSGVDPEIMNAIVKANNLYELAYGEDEYTKSILHRIETLLGGNCTALFVMNGTGANVTILSSLVESYNSILAPDTAHINVDECGAPEKFSGSKLIPIPSLNGKITPNDVKKFLNGFGSQHHSQPNVLSISQPTELGTVYKPLEIKELADLMHSYGGYLHIDGSRISNSAVSLGLQIKEFTADCNIDALSFGGTKNGLLIGEAIVIFNNSKIAEKLPYIRKQCTQLFSKSRFIAAQFEAYLNNNLYLKLAENSNKMAKYLESQLNDIPEIKLTRPVESNAVFAILSPDLIEKLLKETFFYVWDESTNEVRWMCSFNTTKKDIDNFISIIKRNL